MDSSIRASAFAGLGAFALSIIVAVFSRVPFGPLILRALLSGVGFAALTFGALWLLRRFLPELFDDSARPAALGSDGALGSVVDIVLPGGDEDRAEGSTSQEGSARLPHAGAPTGSPLAEAPRRDAQAASYPASVDSGELEREVADLRSDTLISSDPGDVSASGSGAPRPSVALDELDTLPDLEGFSDSFAEGQPGGSEFSDASGGQAGGDASRMMGVSDSMPTAGSPDPGKDPVVLAKAVQTLLRRDQKGQ